MIRVLEISRVPLFKHSLPAETTWFRLGAALVPGEEDCVSERFDLRNIWRLVRDLRRASYDLVVLSAVTVGYAYDTNLFKRFVRRLVRWGATSKLAAAVLEFVFRWSKNTVVFVDLSDLPPLSYEVCALVPGFLAYFKREFDPSRTFHSGARWEDINRRVLPWSLFLPTTEIVTDASEKKRDVFFSGAAVHSAVRSEGLPRLRQLASRGYKIDIPDKRLDYQEFMQRMAEAWLVWSPAGMGWECFRHYEAAYAGAVPVINEPPGPRPLPYTDGVECFYYRAEEDGLEQTIVHALADRERLRVMAARARERVLAEHTRKALAAKMQAAIVAWLQAEKRDSALVQAWAKPEHSYSG